MTEPYVTYGIKGDVHSHQRAMRGVPYVTCDGRRVGPLDSDHHIPVKDWSGWSACHDDIHTLSNTVKTYTEPIACLWHRSVHSLFPDPGRAIIQIQNDRVSAIFDCEAWSTFKSNILENVEQYSLRELSTMISLLGRYDRLIGMWKIRKAMHMM